MLELLDHSLDEKNIWLNRYMPLKNSKYWFKNSQFNLNFTRVELYNDILEGWGNDFPELTQAWQEFVSYAKRVINDGGTIVAGECVISSSYHLRKLLKENTTENIHIKKKIENYLTLIESSYTSCWFLTENPQFEERYM